MKDKPLENGKQGLLFRMLNSPNMGVAIPLFVIILVTTAINPNFLSIKNFTTMFKLMPFIGITALGVSLVLITGTTDISVGRVAGLAGMVFPSLMIINGWSLFPALIAALGVGAAFGAFNGFMISKMRLPDFVATIGTLYIADALRYLMTKGYPLTPLPYRLGEIGTANVLFMTWPFWIMVALYAIVGFVQKNTVFGRRLYAIGGSKEVAQLAGIKVVKTKTLAYIFSGILAAAAGILLTIDINNGIPQNGDGWEFKAIASCAVGGVSLRGGYGNALGVAIGVIIVQLLDNALVMVGMPAEIQKCVTGIVLAASVMYDLFKQSRKIKA